MSPNIKKGILIAIGVSAIIIVGAVVISRIRKPVANTPQGFNELIEKVKKVHPEIYAWWEGLDVSKQISIENSMSTEILTILRDELTKRNYSEQARQLLRNAGYIG
jgi:hypothetical protein